MITTGDNNQQHQTFLPQHAETVSAAGNASKDDAIQAIDLPEPGRLV